MCREALPHRTEHMIKNRFKSLLARARPHPAHLPADERREVRRALTRIKKRRETAAPDPNPKLSAPLPASPPPVLADASDSFLE